MCIRDSLGPERLHQIDQRTDRSATAEPRRVTTAEGQYSEPRRVAVSRPHSYSHTRPTLSGGDDFNRRSASGMSRTNTVLLDLDLASPSGVSVLENGS